MSHERLIHKGFYPDPTLDRLGLTFCRSDLSQIFAHAYGRIKRSRHRATGCGQGAPVISLDFGNEAFGPKAGQTPAYRLRRGAYVSANASDPLKGTWVPELKRTGQKCGYRNEGRLERHLSLKADLVN